MYFFLYVSATDKVLNKSHIHTQMLRKIFKWQGILDRMISYGKLGVASRIFSELIEKLDRHNSQVKFQCPTNHQCAKESDPISESSPPLLFLSSSPLSLPLPPPLLHSSPSPSPPATFLSFSFTPPLSPLPPHFSCSFLFFSSFFLLPLFSLHLFSFSVS